MISIDFHLDKTWKSPRSQTCGHAHQRVAKLFNWDGKSHPKHEWHHSMCWFPGLNQKDKPKQAPAFISLCFLTTGTMWPAIWCSRIPWIPYHIWLTLELGVKINSSLGCFGRTFVFIFTAMGEVTNISLDVEIVYLSDVLWLWPCFFFIELKQ